MLLLAYRMQKMLNGIGNQLVSDTEGLFEFAGSSLIYDLFAFMGLFYFHNLKLDSWLTGWGLGSFQFKPPCNSIKLSKEDFFLFEK